MEALVWVRPRSTNSPLVYQPGDVVVIRPDGWEWGKEEVGLDRAVVRIPDLTPAQQRALVAEDATVRDPSQDGIITPRGIDPSKLRTRVLHAKRRAKVDLERLTPAQRSGIVAGDRPRVRIGGLRNAARLKRDDSQVL